MYLLRATAIFIQLAAFTKAFTTTNETNLSDTLFASTYNPVVRPSSTVDVSVEFHLLTINELSTKTQTLSVSGFFSLTWSDSRLTWDAGSYSGITKTFQTESKIWRPEVIIDNSVTDLEPLHSPDDQIKLRILDSGEVKWETAGLYVVHCDIDITYYPFDSQKCYLEMTSWAYAITELLLKHNSTEINLEDFRENGEWNVLETSTSFTNLNDDGEIRPQLEFLMHLQRRSAFYMLNVMMPVIITGALIPVVFLLPAESGEKVSYVLTLLLAIAVVLTIVSDQMPTTSKHTSVFAIYLALNLGMAAISILVSVAALYAYHQNTSREIPDRWKKAAVRVFMRFPRHKKLGSYETGRGQKSKVLPISTDHKGEDMKMEKISGQEHISLADNEITWMDVSESLDAFSFRVFLIAFVVLLVVFMITLAIGAGVSST